MSAEKSGLKIEHFSPSNIKDNILILRRRLRLSQAEFIERYLSDEHGAPLISVPKLSNLENRGGRDVGELAGIIAARIPMDAKAFQMEPDRFVKNLDLFIEPRRPGKNALPEVTNDLIRRDSYVEKLVQVLSDYLSDSILAGDLRPGDKLPSDRSLAAQFGVGRTSIREALKVLSVLGLIDILPGQGTFVASGSANFFMAPLSWTFLLGERNADNVIDVRNVLEVESARLAAQKADQEGLQKLEEVFSLSDTAYLEGNFQDFLDLDLDFHLAIAQCSQNPIIQNLLLTTRKLIRYISKSGMVNLAQLADIYAEHQRIYTAITTRNPSLAASNMTEHLERSRARYRLGGNVPQ